MRNLLKTRLLKLAAVGAALPLVLTGCSEGAVDWGAELDTEAEHVFRVANGALEGTHHALVATEYMDAVEEATDGRVMFERTAFETVCAMNEVAECVRDGRADIGLTVTDYTPHLLPTHSVMSISFLTDDIQAAVESVYVLHQEYEPAVEVMDRANMEHISTWPVGALLIGAKEPVGTLDDLNGLSTRVAGPVTQRTMEDAGVNVNALTASETYEALQRGVIDSVAASLDFAVNYKVTEQLPYWADPGFGQYTAYGMWWNKDAYESMPEDLRNIVDGVTQEFNEGRTVEVANGGLAAICDGMLASPDVESFSSWDEAETQKWEEVAAENATDQWLEVMDGLNYEHSEEYLAEYMKTYESLRSDDNPVDAGIECANRWQQQNANS